MDYLCRLLSDVYPRLLERLSSVAVSYWEMIIGLTGRNQQKYFYHEEHSYFGRLKSKQGGFDPRKSNSLDLSLKKHEMYTKTPKPSLSDQAL